MVRSLPVLLFASLLAGTTLQAHHSIDAVYDRLKPTEYAATVESMSWLNPHGELTVTILTNGAPVQWRFETAPPRVLAQSGWRMDAFQRGDRVTITAIPAKDGSPRGALMLLRLPNGRLLESHDPWWDASPMKNPQEK